MAKTSIRIGSAPLVALLSLISLGETLGCSDPGGDTMGGTTSGTTSPTTMSDGTTEGTSAGTTSSSGEGTSMCGSGDAPFRIKADAATNMTLMSELKITEVPVMPNSLDITFDWSALTKDFFGHDWDPASIVQVALVPWAADIMTIENGINVDDPNLQSLADVPAVFNPQPGGAPVTSAKITDFQDPGGSGPVPEDVLLDYLDPANGYIITLILQADTNVGVDARMIMAINPTEGATTTNVMLTDTSTTLTADAVFGEPLVVPAGDPNLAFDYGGLTTRSFGGEFRSQLFEIIVGKYPLDADLEAGILDIEVVYENFWRGDAPGVGTTINLGTLTDETGATFPGVDASSKYLVGIVCPACSNPSPWYLSELTPCP